TSCPTFLFILCLAIIGPASVSRMIKKSSSVVSIETFSVLLKVPSGTVYRLDRYHIVLSFLIILDTLDIWLPLAYEWSMVGEIGRKCCFSRVNTSAGLFFVVL